MLCAHAKGGVSVNTETPPAAVKKYYFLTKGVAA